MGYLSIDVWGDLREFISPDLLPVEVPSAAPSGSSRIKKIEPLSQEGRSSFNYKHFNVVLLLIGA